MTTRRWPRAGRWGRLVGFAAVYFVTTFACGALLGPIRVMVIEPRMGPTLAVLCEAPLMLGASYLIAGWVLRKLARSCCGFRNLSTADGLVMGGLALVMLIGAECTLAVTVRGQSVAQCGSRLVEGPGLVAAGLFLGFALMPSVRLRIQKSKIAQ